MFDHTALIKVRNSAQKVLDILTMADRDQDQLHWYNAKLSVLRTEAYRLIDADGFVAAESLITRARRLERRRDQVAARQMAAYDRFWK